MTENQLLKELKSLDKVVLLEIIMDLYKTNISVQEQLEYYIKPDIEKVLKAYKKKMEKIFSPSRDCVIKISDPQKLINAFMRLDPPPNSIADYLLFAVEEGIRYVDTYLDERYRLYEELGSILGNAIAVFEDKNMQDKYKERVNAVIDSSEKLSFQLYDILLEYYISDDSE
jgi:hypothetical protein